MKQILNIGKGLDKHLQQWGYFAIQKRLLIDLACRGIEGCIGKFTVQKIKVSGSSDHGSVISAQAPIRHGKGYAFLFAKTLPGSEVL